MRQTQALSLLLGGKSVFLTGPPGAGKTYVLNQFIRLAKRTGKSVAITASTGIAATHIGGTTIHSWSGLGIKDELTPHDLEKLTGSSKYTKRYNATDTLVIDEISMLHGARLDMVNAAAKAIRDDPRPFGGMQVVLVGDLFQLPPVSRGSSEVDFVHNSTAWQELAPHSVYLTEQHRQSGSDTLLDILSAMRSGDIEDIHRYALAERLGKIPDENVQVIRLYSHNANVDTINQRHLNALGGDTKRYTMTLSGNAAKRESLAKSILAPNVLELKLGAEVMFVANNPSGRYANGTRGRVTGWNDSQPVVTTNDGKQIVVTEHSWSVEEDGRIIAEASQLPLRLAWAITIHKSQGMSLDAAEVDLSRSFTPGMGYVALSRVRSIDGLYLMGANRMALAMHPEIFEIDARLRDTSATLASETPDYEEPPETPDEKQLSTVPENLLVFDTLKNWRLSTAKKEGVAPFMVAHDKTLRELASKQPTTKQALLGITGIGKAKLDKYGDELVAILTAAQQN